jgi:ABC-type nitrate/sulfonate/bicarbonate transport system substrate-binding protein
VLVTTPRTLRERPQLVRGTVAALRRGYTATIADPQAAIAALTAAAPGVDAAAARRELDAVLPAFTPAGGGAVGTLDLATLRTWATWEQRFGITASVPDVGRLFAPRVAAAR